MPNLYVVRLVPTALTTAKTLIQIKAGAVPLWIVKAKVFQVTKTSTELLDIKQSRWTGAYTAGTVTAFTPLLKSQRSGGAAALAVGGTSATGVNATAEPSGGTQEILDEDVWNVLNGSWMDYPIPEDRIFINEGGLYTLRLDTAPAASMTIGAIVSFIEAQ
jgi:hypothetical protein